MTEDALVPSFSLPDGRSLYYLERGQGEPLLFLNGLAGDHLYWNGQVRFFSKRYRCLAIDHRDVGRSSPAEGPYTIREMAADVAAFSRGLGLPAADVVGLSMGGMIAQELALAEPGMVRSLVLVGTLGRADPWFQGTLDAFGIIRRHVADTPAFFEAILPWWVSHRFLADGERATWLRWLLRQNPHLQSLESFLRQLAATSGHDALDRLGTIRCPVLVLVGEDDAVAPPRYSRELVERLPGARFEVLAGVGHAPAIEDPQLFNRHLDSFLKEVGGCSHKCNK